MKQFSMKLALMALGTLFAFCSPDISKTSADPDSDIAGSPVALDESRVVSTVSVVGPDGEVLTIDSGTTILQLDLEGMYIPIPAEGELTLSLTSGNQDESILPSGSTPLALFTILAEVDGSSADLIFIPADKTFGSPMPCTGANIEIDLSGLEIPDGTDIRFCKSSQSGTLTYIGSWFTNTPAMVLAKRNSGLSSGSNANVSPNGTGQYQFYYSPILNSTSAQMPSSGVYWTMFSSIPDTTYNVGKVVIGGPCFAGHVHVDEPSTGEILAEVSFPMDVNCVTYTSIKDGVKYWVERTQASDGSTTAIKVASTAANIPVLRIQMYSVESGEMYYSVHNLPPDGGVHTPDGAVLTNPYEDSSLKFGGAKKLDFQAKFDQGRKIRLKVEEAGYETFSIRYDNGIYSIDVDNTSTGRAYIEEDVLNKENWFLVEGSGNGNAGVYEFNDSVIVYIESHADGDTVSNQNITIKGKFKNPYVDKPVTDIRVFCSDGTGTQEVHATVTDSTFSINLDLYIGMNMLTFLPMGTPEGGEEEVLSKYTLRAKGDVISELTLHYDAKWIGTVDFTRTVTSRSMDPDTSVCVSTDRLTANLKMDFNGSKLWYTRKSHENAVSCSELDNCFLFTGSNSGGVTISENDECKERDCDDGLPLVTQSRSEGQGTAEDYELKVQVTLTPWETGDNSTDRRYHLRVYGGAPMMYQSDPDWPTGQSELYDCSTEQWESNDYKIAPGVAVDRGDILTFSDNEDLENYSISPTTAKTWTFSGNDVSQDGLTVTEYSVILTVSPQSE